MPEYCSCGHPEFQHRPRGASHVCKMCLCEQYIFESNNPPDYPKGICPTCCGHGSISDDQIVFVDCPQCEGVGKV